MPQTLSVPASYNPLRRLFFSLSLTFAGYQPVLTGQQGFQGLMGVQQSPHGQGVMSSQQGAPVQGVMVSYPTMSSYQVRASSWKSPATSSRFLEETLQDVLCGGWLVGSWMPDPATHQLTWIEI